MRNPPDDLAAAAGLARIDDRPTVTPRPVREERAATDPGRTRPPRRLHARGAAHRGFRDLVLARSATTAADQQLHNANRVGGDIGSVYFCSSSTPPGPGVHGMAGLHAARRALKHRFGLTADPLRGLITPQER